MPSEAPAVRRRLAGLVVPLFSMPSSRSWGIGEIGDIPAMAAWLRRAGFGILQLLPLNEMASWSQSPYSATSAMAIDPLYLSVHEIEEFAELGGAGSMPPAWQEDLDLARRAPGVDYVRVRRVKAAACARAFARFRDVHLKRNSARARAFLKWVAREAWWVEAYALFRALHLQFSERSWREWPADLRDAGPEALAAARAQRLDQVRYRQYLQWQAAEQWEHARRAARPVALFGDVPFMVDGDSADVWARQRQFLLDASVGAPPDAFSEDGQDWGLPPCDWDAMAADGFAWIHERARRSADLFDGFRIDHLVGFYRTYIIPSDGRPRSFRPAGEAEQLALGETIIRAFAAGPARVIAEDLGTVPDYVRASLDRLGVPGFKVLRWERYWDDPGRPFRDPAAYAPASVATSGTHDTETLAGWWDGLPADERVAVSRIPALRRILGEGFDFTSTPYGPDLRDAFLHALFESSSDLVILPIQDLFGWRDRINVPATITDENWSWRLRWPADAFVSEPEADERGAAAARWAEETGRLSAHS